MKFNADLERSMDRLASGVVALGAALALVAAAVMVLGPRNLHAAQAVAKLSAPKAHPDLGTPPSDPAAPAASDQLAPTP